MFCNNVVFDSVPIPSFIRWSSEELIGHASDHIYRRRRKGHKMKMSYILLEIVAMEIFVNNGWRLLNRITC